MDPFKTRPTGLFATALVALSKSGSWPRFHRIRYVQKLPKNRLWRICIKKNGENQNDWLNYLFGRKKNKVKKKKKKIPARLLVRPWPDQPDRLLRPCSLTKMVGVSRNKKDSERNRFS